MCWRLYLDYKDGTRKLYYEGASQDGVYAIMGSSAMIEKFIVDGVVTWEMKQEEK